MTGITHYSSLKGINHPISKVLEEAGQNWLAGFIDVGAILGMTTVLLVLLYGQIRISYAMSRDGLLPKLFSKTHAYFRTPFYATWFFGLIAGIIGGLLPSDRLAQLVNIGTLFAFTMVSLSVLIFTISTTRAPPPFPMSWGSLCPPCSHTLLSLFDVATSNIHLDCFWDLDLTWHHHLFSLCSQKIASSFPIKIPAIKPSIRLFLNLTHFLLLVHLFQSYL